MSGWLLAVREVYAAGGHVRIGRLASPHNDITVARVKGLLEPGVRGRGEDHWATLTPLGWAVCKNKLEAYTPYVPAQPQGGRAPAHQGVGEDPRPSWLGGQPGAGSRLTCHALGLLERT